MSDSLRTSDPGSQPTGKLVAGPALLLYPLVFLTLAAGVQAQPVSQLELEACAAISTDQERLLCFEMLTRRGSNVQPSAVSEKIPEAERSVMPSVSSATYSISSPEPDRTSTPEIVPMPEVAAKSSLDRRSRVDNSPVDVNASVPPASVEDDHDAGQATVVSISESLRGNLRFHFENGQIWHQIEAQHVPLPDSMPFAVRLTQGVFGETRLRIGDSGRLVRIRQLK